MHLWTPLSLQRSRLMGIRRQFRLLKRRDLNKIAPFSGWEFRMHFHQNLVAIRSELSNWLDTNIGYVITWYQKTRHWVNWICTELLLNRRQTITWTKNDLVYWTIFPHKSVCHVFGVSLRSDTIRKFLLIRGIRGEFAVSAPLRVIICILNANRYPMSRSMSIRDTHSLKRIEPLTKRTILAIKIFVSEYSICIFYDMLFQTVPLTVSQYWFGQWLSAEQSHQCWEWRHITSQHAGELIWFMP